MAHELDFNRETGKANTFSVRETPWHKEGHILTAAPTFEEALALGGLDYEVEKQNVYRQTYVPVPTGGELREWKPSGKAFVTVRKDRGEELGSVGPDYQPLQNIDAFRAITPLLDKGVLTLETGGTLRGGADAWLLGKFDIEKFGPVVREVFADEVVPYALFTNNHSGRRNATVAETPIRVVCANTLGLAEHEIDGGRSRSVGIRHEGAVEARAVEAAEKLFGALIERYETIAKQYRLLKAFALDENLFRSLVIAPAIADPRLNPKFNPEARLAENVVTRYEKKVAEVTRLWTEGTGHTGDHSAWEAYNGLVEAVDHNAELFPTRGGAYRTASLIDGRLRDIKGAVLTNLVGAAENRAWRNVVDSVFPAQYGTGTP